MRSLTHTPIDDLRLAIDCLPLRTREARRVGFGWLAERRAHADAERALGEVERRRRLLPK